MKVRYAAVVASMLASAWPNFAQADFIGTFKQVGLDVVFSGSGSFSLNGLTPITDDIRAMGSGIIPSAGLIVSGVPQGANQPVTGYTGFSGPAGFGSSALTLADGVDGDVFGFIGSSGALFLLPNYSPNAQIKTGLTFTGQSLATLGLLVGPYVYTSAADTITINVGINAVPVPASAPLFGAGLIALGAAGYTAKRKRAAAS